MIIFVDTFDDYWAPSDVQGEAKWVPDGESPLLESMRRDRATWEWLMGRSASHRDAT